MNKLTDDFREFVQDDGINDNKSDFIKNMLPPNKEQMIKEFNEGKPIASPLRVDGLDRIINWMPGYVNTWTGWPNHGKTTITLFLMLVKSIKDGWKWSIWSPEQINSHKVNGRPEKSSSNIYDLLIYMKTGKNPYRHIAFHKDVTKQVPQMPLEEYIEALEWVQKYFFVFYIDKDRTIFNLLKQYKFSVQEYGVNGCFLDPWKNVTLEHNRGTFTQADILHSNFADIKDFAVQHDQVFNIVAHPKSDKSFSEKDYVKPSHLSGGQAWWNSMDMIISTLRPNKEDNPKDNTVWMRTWKVRDEILVADSGTEEDIYFDRKQMRYYVHGKCPIDNAIIPDGFKPFPDTVTNFYEKENNNNDELPF